MLIGASGETFNQGTVYAYSGKDRGLLWRWTRIGTCNSGESLDGAGDINGDGRPDAIVGIPECNKVSTLLHDGTEWWTVQETRDLGTSGAGAGDVNLDGFDDVIAGESYADPFGRHDAGSVYVYSGRDGTVLYRFDGQVAGDRLGLAVGGAGDVNADGYPDLIAGAERASPGGALNAGAAYVYSGRDGILLHQFAGFQPTDYFGHACTGGGDLDGDGHGDLLIGARGAPSGSFTGAVFVYSGRTGALLYRLDGRTAGDQFGLAIDRLEDIDLDGVPGPCHWRG